MRDFAFNSTVYTAKLYFINGSCRVIKPAVIVLKSTVQNSNTVFSLRQKRIYYLALINFYTNNNNNFKFDTK